MLDQKTNFNICKRIESLSSIFVPNNGINLEIKQRKKKRKRTNVENKQHATIRALGQ